jgi:hypothetical protein
MSAIAMSVSLTGLGSLIVGVSLWKGAMSSISMRVSGWSMDERAGVMDGVGSKSSWPKPGAVRTESFMSREWFTRAWGMGDGWLWFEA